MHPLVLQVTAAESGKPKEKELGEVAVAGREDRARAFTHGMEPGLQGDGELSTPVLEQGEAPRLDLTSPPPEPATASPERAASSSSLSAVVSEAAEEVRILGPICVSMSLM